MSIINNMFLLPFSEDLPLLNRYVIHIFCLTNSFKGKDFDMNNRTQSLDFQQKLVILNLLHQGGLLANSLATRTHAIYITANGPGPR
jgi:hypothetical protein